MMATVTDINTRRWSALTIRMAVAADGVELRRLAYLDSALPLGGAKLVAELGGEIVAAVALDDGRVIADPFRHTADIVELLRVRAEQFANSAELTAA